MSLDKKRVSRRQALGVLMTVSAATLAAACGVTTPATPTQVAPAPAGGGTGPAATVSSAASGAAQPKAGGNLRVGAVGDVANVDPQSWGPKNGFSIFMAYDTLTTYDLDLKPQPQLAESWQQSSDGKQLTVNLRKGVQFHSGRELTSEDVVASLARPLDAKLQGAMASFTILQGFVPTGTTFEARDKYTVDIKSPVAWPSIFDYFQVLHIVDKDQAAAPITQPNGTGPFKFVEWVQGQHLRFEKHPNYWLSGRPYLDSVQVNIRADIQAMTAELEAGASDLIILPSWIDFQRLKSDPNYQAIVTPMPGYFYMFQPNVTFKPLDDKRVRQALNYAIDRKRIVESVILGTQETMATPWRSNSPAYDPVKQNAYAFDLDKAKSLLNEAGISSLTFDMVIPTGVTEYATMTQIYQNDSAENRHHTGHQAAGHRAAAQLDAKPDLKWHVRFQRHLGGHGAGVVLHIELDRGREAQQRWLLQRSLHAAGRYDRHGAGRRQTESAVSGPERLPAGRVVLHGHHG